MMMALWLLAIACTAEDIGFCADGTVEVVVEVFTDPFPRETSWDIKDGIGTVVASGGIYNDQDTLYVEKLCLQETEECDGLAYTFTIYDTANDGICCFWGNGYYNVYADNELKVTGGDFDWSYETTSLCNGPCLGKDTFSECIIRQGCYWRRGGCRECASITRPRFCNKEPQCMWSSGSCVGDPNAIA